VPIVGRCLRCRCSFLLLNGVCHFEDKFIVREEASIVKAAQYGFKPLMPDRILFGDYGELIQLICQELDVSDIPCPHIGSHHLRRTGHEELGTGSSIVGNASERIGNARPTYLGHSCRPSSTRRR
jgi:hypothetical protein